MRGNASFASSHIEMPNTTSVQTIRPIPGLTRKVPPLSEEDAAVMAMVDSIEGLEEESEQARDEAVEHAGLGEREAQPLDRSDLVAHLPLARDRLDHLAAAVADADPG